MGMALYTIYKGAPPHPARGLIFQSAKYFMLKIYKAMCLTG